MQMSNIIIHYELELLIVYQLKLMKYAFRKRS